MKVTTVSAAIRFSQDTGKGTWKSLEIGAEGVVEGGETWTEAQARLYQDLAGQLRTLWNGKAQPVDGGDGADQELDTQQPEHWCEEHAAEFRRYERQGRVWYSHRLEDGKWCKEK